VINSTLSEALKWADIAKIINVFNITGLLSQVGVGDLLEKTLGMKGFKMKQLEYPLPQVSHICIQIYPNR